MNLKKYLEMIETKRSEMRAILDKANTEERTLTKEEREAFDKLDEEIRELTATVNAIQTERSLETPDVEEPIEETKEDEEERSVEDMEARAFEDYIRGEVSEERTAVNMTKGDNGAVVPASIANKIIEKVVEISPIFHDADRYNVGGTLSIPYYDDATSDIVMDYADEFTDGESTSGKFLSISLTGFLGRAICDVSKSLINNSQFDIVNFVINRMARNIAIWIEGQLLNGTTNKIEGLSGVTLAKESASATALTSDELIDVQSLIPDVYQSDAYWIMNKATRTAISKLKDGQNNYLLIRDFNSRWGYTLLGKDVYTTDNMVALGSANAGKTAIYYGDMKGLAVKVSEDINIEVLRETKARQHAVEVLGFVELDAKVQNAQMIAKLTLKSA